MRWSISISIFFLQKQAQQQQRQQQEQLLPEDRQQEVEILKGNSFILPELAFGTVGTVGILPELA